MISIILCVVNFLHPFHVSVSDIKFKEDKKAIEISTRIFLDDLELALREFSGNEALDIVEKTSWDSVNVHLEKYLLERIALFNAKGDNYDIKYVGAEIEEDVMWCYLEIEKVKKLRSVTVTNSILHETWADQENLVHFRAFDGVKSARLYKGQETKKFTWE